MVVFLSSLLGFRELAEGAGGPLYEFFWGTLTVTCEGFGEAVILHTLARVGGPLRGQEPPFLLTPPGQQPDLCGRSGCISPKGLGDICLGLEARPFWGTGRHHSLVASSELRSGSCSIQRGIAPQQGAPGVTEEEAMSTGGSSKKALEAHSCTPICTYHKVI